MRLSTICTGVGAIWFLWFVGALDFAPKLWADIGKWDGADSINRFGSIGMKAIANQWQNKIGDKPVTANEAKELGESCKPSTAADGVRLPYSEYQKHLNAIALKVRSPLQDKNSYTFCEGNANRLFSKMVGTDSYIYLPEWQKDKALIIKGSNGSETVIDIPKSDAIDK